MSDELEFEIDDDEANRMESYNFDTDHNRGRGRQTVGGGGPILDLNDEDSQNGNNRTGDEPLRMLKRGSTQATAAEGVNNTLGVKKNSSEPDNGVIVGNRYQSPFMASI